MYLIYDSHGLLICQAPDAATADAYARACAGDGRTVRVVEEGKRMGRTYRKEPVND